MLRRVLVFYSKSLRICFINLVELLLFLVGSMQNLLRGCEIKSCFWNAHRFSISKPLKGRIGSKKVLYQRKKSAGSRKKSINSRIAEGLFHYRKKGRWKLNTLYLSTMWCLYSCITFQMKVLKLSLLSIFSTKSLVWKRNAK